MKRFIRRFKFLKGIEGICLTAICALLLLAVGPGVEQIKSFVPYAPLVYSVITAATLLGLIFWTIIQLARRFSQEHAARYVEQKQPKLRNNLINSLQLYPQVASAQIERWIGFHFREPAYMHEMKLSRLSETNCYRRPISLQYVSP